LLAWHYDIKAEIPTGTYCYVEIAISEEDMSFFSALAYKIKSSNSVKYQFPYSPGGYQGVRIQNEPDLSVFLGDSAGLTCATFVLAAIKNALEIELVEEQSWRSRGKKAKWEDREWVKIICSFLRKTKASPRHIAAIRKRNDFIRIRALQVIGAASVYSGTPVVYSIADSEANEVASLWRAIGKDIRNI
jgi:hypothetical protein